MNSPGSIHDLASPLAAAALDAVENMLVITDRDGAIVYVNKAFTEVTGYAYDEAIGQSPRLLRSGMQDDAFYEQLWSKVLGGQTWSGELVNRKKDGELYTDRMTITPLHDAVGALQHFVAVKRDVSGHLAALTAGNPGGIAHIDPSGRLVYANDRLSSILGRPFEGLLGRGWLDALGTRACAQVEEALASLTDGSDVVSVVDVPEDRSLRVHLAPLHLGDHGQAGVIATVEDVSGERRALRSLREREAYARGILESLGTPTAVVDGVAVIREVNRAWRAHAEEAGADPIRTGVGVDYRGVCQRSQANGCQDAEVVLRALEEVLSGASGSERLDYRLDGPTASWWELGISALEVEQGGAVLTHTDVTWRHEIQALLEEQARTDPLTGLANRSGLLAYGDGAMARARRSSRDVTVLFVDLDAFKPINDRFGHRAGDEVLRASAARLQAVTRETDCVARVGGDEFVVICEDLSEEETPILAARIGRALAEPLDVGTEVGVTASIGSVRVAGRADLAQAVADADAEMYAAKRERR
jgi:diguanylate cyclase (GGDEF)-like protein/PAS domain S-box-containing protein